MVSYSVSCSFYLSALSVVIRRDLFVSLFHFRVSQYETVVVNTFNCHYQRLYKLQIRKLTRISKTPCLAITRTMKKCANDWRRFSQAVDQKLLLPVSWEKARSNNVAERVPASHSWLRRLDLDVTFDFQTRQRRITLHHSTMLIAEWVGQPFYCRWRTKAVVGHSSSTHIKSL